MVAHYGDGFDVPFLRGRLFHNKLPPLPDKRTLDTYLIAKQKFRRTLNSNKLDHLAMLLNIGRKNRTEDMLWVKCANNDKEAIAEMAAYNIQDVELLEKVFLELRPHFSKKMNLNLMHDDAINRCKSCGSDALTFIGYEMFASTMRPQFRCDDCKAISSFTPKQVEKDGKGDRKSTRLNSSHLKLSHMPSSA